MTGYNPMIKDYMAQSIFLPSSIKRKRRHSNPLAFAASFALVLVFSGVIALLSSMPTAADSSASVTIKSLGDFRQASDLCPDVFVPHKIPGRYSFESLTVTKAPAGNFHAEYIYSEKDGSHMKIRQETVKEELSLEEPVITADHSTFVQDGTVIDISGRLEKSEMLDIFAYHPEQQE
jgi:hypothetical protein